MFRKFRREVNCPVTHPLVAGLIGTMVFIDDKNLINKSGTKTIRLKIMASNFVNKKGVIVH